MKRSVVAASILVVVVFFAGSGRGQALPVAEGEAAPPAAPTNAAVSTNAPARAVDPLRELFGEARGLLKAGQTNAVLALLEASRGKPEFAEAGPQIYKAITDVMLMGGRLDEVQQRLEKDFSSDPQTTAAGVHVALSYALRGQHLDAADALIDLLAAVPESDEAVPTAYRAQLDVMRGDRAAAMRKFDALLSGGNPGAIHHVYSMLAGRASKDGDREAGDRLSLFILRREGAPESLKKQAVLAYCAAAAGEHIGEYPDRVATLIEAGVPPALLRAPLREDFHRVLNEGDAEIGDAMLGLAKRLAALEEDAEARDQYQALALDALVSAGDYARALAMVDAGFRADNMEWRAAVVPKLRAHAALQAGRKREAIEHFRAFMGVIAGQGAAQPGATPHGNLALNATRIGDLWQELGEEEKAKKAYREALSHYTEALKRERIAPAEKEELQQALEAVEGKIASTR